MQEATWISSNEALVLARELGERIRSYRSDSGVEVADLSSRTRITVRYLQAIEAGRLAELPGPVFVKGFIRSICSELGRDPDPLIDLVDQIQVEEPVEEPVTSNGSRRTTPLVISGILLACLIIGGILLHGGPKDEEVVGQAEGTGLTEMMEEEAALSREEINSEPPVVELDLVLRATEKTWLRIQADAEEPWETTMKAGDVVPIKAMDRVALFIGNAGGILLELNGRRFGPLGKQGQVISNYVITKDNL